MAALFLKKVTLKLSAVHCTMLSVAGHIASNVRIMKN